LEVGVSFEKFLSSGDKNIITQLLFGNMNQLLIAKERAKQIKFKFHKLPADMYMI
jgi:hypothetical protein